MATQSSVLAWEIPWTEEHGGGENLVRKETCTPMFTAALFTTAKTWKQPQYLRTDTYN